MKPTLSRTISLLIEEEPAGRLDRFVALLDCGRITDATPPGALRTMIGGGDATAGRLRDVLRAWDDRGPMQLLAEVITTAIAVRNELSQNLTSVAIVYTGPPGLRGNPARPTRAVLMDIVRKARTSLLFVGYSVTTDLARSGENYLILHEFVRAAQRGVDITFIVHGDHRNRYALLQAWPSTIPPPPVFTRPARPDDEMASLHAKLVVADQKDALITSANLTYHGLEANLELGVRLQGPVAADMVEHFNRLIRENELIEWKDGSVR